MLKTKLYSSTVLIIGAVQFGESLIISLPLSYFPNYSVGLGASVASVGLFTSSFMLSSALLSPKLGSLSDTYGRKKLIILGLFGVVIVGALTGLAPSWIWLLIIRLIHGVVSSAVMLAAEALLIDSVSPAKRGEASGFVMSMAAIGMNVGPLLGGSLQWVSVSQGLSLLDSYRVPYFVGSLMAVFVLVLVLIKIQESKPKEPRLTMMNGASSTAPKIPTSRSFKVLLLYSFLTGTGMGLIMPIIALFYNDKFGLTPVEIGLILSITGFIGLMASWVAGRLSDRAGRKPFITAGDLTFRILDFALPLTGNVTQAVGVASVRSMGFNVSMPAMRALRADITPDHARGRYFGMFMTTFTAGNIIGPIASTFIYDIYHFRLLEIGGLILPGYGIPFFVNSFLGIAATILLVALVKEPSAIKLKAN